MLDIDSEYHPNIFTICGVVSFHPVNQRNGKYVRDMSTLSKFRNNFINLGRTSKQTLIEREISWLYNDVRLKILRLELPRL